MGTLEIYDEYSSLGLQARPITKGKEFDLVRKYIKYRKQTFIEKPNRKLAIFIEPHINGSYPDLVCAEYDPNSFQQWSTNRNNLTVDDIKILQTIVSRDSISIPYICKLMSISENSVTHSLKNLEKAELISIKENAIFCLPKHPIVGITKLDVIEAKIDNMSQAIQQAIKNTTFASQSIILTKRVKKIRSFTVDKASCVGIGIHLYQNGCFTEITPPKKNSHPISWKALQLNEYLGRVVNYERAHTS